MIDLKFINFRAAQPVGDVGQSVRFQSFVKMIMPGQDDIRAPFAERPAHPVCRAVPAGCVRRMMEHNDVERRGGGGQRLPQPDRLLRFDVHAVRLFAVAVQHEKANGSLREFVIPFVLPQVEIFEIETKPAACPIVVSGGWEEPSGLRTLSIFSGVVHKIFVVILPDVVVHSIRLVYLIVVSGGDDEIRVPAFDEVRHVRFRLPRHAVIADDGKDDAIALGARVRQPRLRT